MLFDFTQCTIKKGIELCRKSSAIQEAKKLGMYLTHYIYLVGLLPTIYDKQSNSEHYYIVLQESLLEAVQHSEITKNY